MIIIQPQHKHQKQLTQNLNQFPPKPQKQQKNQPPQIFKQLLSSSGILIGEGGIKVISNKLREVQKRVLYSYSSGPNQYLNLLITQGQGQTKQLLKQIIGLKSDIAVSQIQSGILILKQRQFFGQVKRQITDKLGQIKRGLVSLSGLQRKASQQVQNMIQFKKKGYWLQPTQKKQQVKSFLSKMRRIHSQQKHKLAVSMQAREQTMRISMQKQRLDHQNKIKNRFIKQSQKQSKWKQQKQKYINQHKKRSQQIAALLKKYSVQKPIYLKKQQQFIKKVVQPMEEARQKKLQQIKQKHHPFDPEQFQQHIQRYNQYKQSLLEQRRKKEQQQSQMNSKLESQLKDLYHSRFHKIIQSRLDNPKLSKIQLRKKVKQYNSSVLQHHKPIIDQSQRQQIEKRIIDLQLLQDKSKIKIIKQDGSISIQNKPTFDHKKIGVQYLEQLKDQNQGKPKKKERSASLIQQNHRYKPIDYLRQSRPQVKLKKTLSGWKKVFDDQSCSPRDKFQSVMQQALVMQQKAQQKQKEMKAFKKGEKALAIKQQMDKLYIESVAAKMVLLKDVILNDKKQ